MYHILCIESFLEGHLGCFHTSAIANSDTMKSLLFRAIPMAYGGSQARGRIRTTAPSLHHRHSNMGSEPCLQPTPQHVTTRDP